VMFGTEGGRGPNTPEVASQLDRAQQERLPHFEHPGIWPDEYGRVWVTGTVGDSAFIDVFSGSAHLGRVTHSCSENKRRIGHSLRWIVLVCTEGADSNG